MTWVMRSKETDLAIWKSDNRYDLEVIMSNLKATLGDKFYIDLNSEKEESND